MDDLCSAGAAEPDVAVVQATHVLTPDIERAWRALAARRVHSLSRVGLTPTQIEALGL